MDKIHLHDWEVISDEYAIKIVECTMKKAYECIERSKDE